MQRGGCGSNVEQPCRLWQKSQSPKDLPAAAKAALMLGNLRHD